MRCLVGIGLALSLSSSAAALDPDRSLKELHHTAWRAREGAPSQISALAQTRDGYLWIGSALGLFRFDGIEFERYVPPAGTALPSHNIYALRATPDGGLWIAFRPSGIGFLKDGRLLVRNGPEDPAPVFDLAADADVGAAADRDRPHGRSDARHRRGGAEGRRGQGRGPRGGEGSRRRCGLRRAPCRRRG